MTVEELKNSGWVVYHYVRGSHAYGLNVETSDIDEGGVFMLPEEYLYGLRSNYIEQVSDAKSDVVFYEFGRWIELLLKSNPNALESLFVPDDCIIGEVHPIIQELRLHRDIFLSQDCFNSIYGYSVSQISKARGLNKKIVNPITERKTVLDFCYVPNEQGSKKIVDWLADYGMKQKYCGLVLLPNMHDTYGVYYDWATHFICEFGINMNNLDSINDMGRKILDYENPENFYRYKNLRNGMDKFLNAFDHLRGAWYYLQEELYGSTPYGFGGIVSENNESNEVRVCAVPKDIEPITYMTYNKSGYESHCRDYKEYKEWEEKRNPIRYESNLNKNYDSKNIMHCMRLTRMAKELAQGKGFKVRRTEDRDYLLDIRNHKFEYDEIMRQVEKEKTDMEKAIETTTLQKKPDYEKINDLLIRLRRQFYNKKGY